MPIVRLSAVAGVFYPKEPDVLMDLIERMLDEASAKTPPSIKARGTPRALVVPHAGLLYSGPIAASAYCLLTKPNPPPRRVVILGPSHRIFFKGIATSTATSFRTPLGDIPVDRELVEQLESLPGVDAYDPAHTQEHSIEIQLPFLKVQLDQTPIVPLVTGESSVQNVAQVTRTLLNLPETLIVISTDLSHYFPSDQAHLLDTRTASAIISEKYHPVDNQMACGSQPLNGFLMASHEAGLKGELLDLRSSGDTAGPKSEVVGYGSFAFWPS
ncbi:MAG: AmmeMemoRadiSam system protein B [Leptospirillum sp.]|jgi:hypothetical protein|nr:AmmeMemoRadiSam system protein B [Nitrospiraceae bacterium]